MYTDCAEYGEWVSGKNSAGLTVSASMFSLKAGSAIGSAVPAALLAMYGFVKGAESQSAEAIEGIQIMYNLLAGRFLHRRWSHHVLVQNRSCAPEAHRRGVVCQAWAGISGSHIPLLTSRSGWVNRRLNEC